MTLTGSAALTRADADFAPAFDAALAEARDTLEDVIEPYLIQEGLILRTSRGRMLGEGGWRHLGIMPPRTQPQLDLLPDAE